MKFTTDKIIWTTAMKNFAMDLIEKKFSRNSENASDAEIKLSKLNNNLVKVEICLEGSRAQSTSDDFYASLVNASNKLKTIIKKSKKLKKTLDLKMELIQEPEGTLDTYSSLISKEKLFELSPISLEEAMMEIQKTDYPFYVFKDIDDDNNICILYIRHEDSYGLIRCR